MKTKLRLLPHWCQVLGYSYVLGFMICLGYAILRKTGIFPDIGLIRGIDSFHRFVLNHWSIVGGLNFVMIFLTIFSKEKVEDEMTISIRVNALLYLVYFIFLIHFVSYFFSNESPIRHALFEVKDFLLGDFGVTCICYAFLYKILLWINLWRARNEE